MFQEIPRPRELVRMDMNVGVQALSCFESHSPIAASFCSPAVERRVLTKVARTAKKRKTHAVS